MSEKVLGPKGSERRRRRGLTALMLALGATLLFVVVAAAAVYPANPLDPDKSNYVITVDENGPNDVPGQKDLTLHGINDDGLPDSIAVLWDWDETSISGANTLDACSLIDTDGDLKANFAVCLTLGGSPLGTTKSTTIYSCGDDRVDRCSSPTTPLTGTLGSTCTFAVTSNTDPFPGPPARARGASYPSDTRAKCTIDLNDFGVNVTEAVLINTCSYPSQQPNSDPSDCVLVPRDAFIRVIKDAGDVDDVAFSFSLNGGAAFDVYDDGTGELVGIVGGTSNSLAEGTVPSGWEFVTASCTGATGTNSSNGTRSGQTISGIRTTAGTTVTCTFQNQLSRASLLIAKTDGTSALAGAAFAIDEDGDPETTLDQTPIPAVANETGLFCIGDLVAGSQHTVVETTVPDGYDGAEPQTLTASDTGTCAARVAADDAPDATFTNTFQPGSVAVHKEDDAGNAMDGVTFTLHLDDSGAPGDPTSYSCVTGLPADPNDGTGDCTIEGVPAGTYWIVESNVPSGYTAADPQQVIVTGGGETETGFTFVNERTHKVIVIVCHEGTDTLAPSDVTNGDPAVTETTIGTAPAGVDEEALCGIEQGAFGGKAHGEKQLTVDVGSDAHATP
jgi:hypothetical protein